MPGTPTTRLGLPIPAAADPADGPGGIGNLATALDPKTVVFTQGTLAARPAAGVQGRFYMATDQSVGELYYDTGTNWARYSPRYFQNLIGGNGGDINSSSTTWTTTGMAIAIPTNTNGWLYRAQFNANVAIYAATAGFATGAWALQYGPITGGTTICLRNFYNYVPAGQSMQVPMHMDAYFRAGATALNVEVFQTLENGNLVSVLNSGNDVPVLTVEQMPEPQFGP
jgi:hypothetical protein